jgi:putative permease
MLKIISKWLKRNSSHPEAVALIVIITILLLVFWLLGSLLTPIILSIIIAYLLNGIVQYLVHRKMQKLFAVILVFCLFLGAFVGTIILLFPILIQQLATLSAEVPKMLISTEKFVTNFSAAHSEIFSAAQLNFVVQELSNYMTRLGQFIFDFSLASISSIISITLYTVLMPILVFFFLKDGKKVITWLSNLLPQPHTTINKIGEILDLKMWAYIRGKIIEMIIVTVVSSIAFIIVGVNYAVLLGVCIGLSEIVPYIGAVLVTIPIVLIGFLQWGWDFHFISLLIIYTSIMILDANILIPVLFSGKMHLHPIAILLSVLIFGSLLGFWGVFFAIPLATLIDILLRHWPQKIEKIKE